MSWQSLNHGRHVLASSENMLPSSSHHFAALASSVPVSDVIGLGNHRCHVCAAIGLHVLATSLSQNSLETMSWKPLDHGRDVLALATMSWQPLNHGRHVLVTSLSQNSLIQPCLGSHSLMATTGLHVLATSLSQNTLATMSRQPLNHGQNVLVLAAVSWQPLTHGRHVLVTSLSQNSLIQPCRGSHSIMAAMSWHPRSNMLWHARHSTAPACIFHSLGMDSLTIRVSLGEIPFARQWACVGPWQVLKRSAAVSELTHPGHHLLKSRRHFCCGAVQPPPSPWRGIAWKPLAHFI